MKTVLGLVLGVVALAQLTGCCCPCGYLPTDGLAAPTTATQARAVAEHVVAQAGSAAESAQKF